MTGTVDIVGFMDLASLFRSRGWPSPNVLPLDGPIDGVTLLSRLDVPEDAVECVFINHHVFGLADALIHPGDRVALVLPGVPGPHRFCLGIYQKKR